ncbi:hypothetical protein ANRL1_04840 [Anaerolineae bacterium]|nr:hypothetical protein ANRL1_04840 [Anaerolineae bacterium]
MITRNRIRAEQSVTAYTRRNARQFMFAKLGNNAGTVEIGTSNRVFIRLHGDPNQVTRALNSNSLPLVAGLPVWVEEIHQGGGVRYEVIARASEWYQDDPYANAIGDHAWQHARMDFNQGGFDPLELWTRAHPELRGQENATPEMSVWINPGRYPMLGVETWWAGGKSPPITAPASAGYERCDLVYLGEDNLPHLQAGTEAVYSVFARAPKPSPPSGGYFPSCYVWTKYGYTAVLEQDIADARFAFMSAGASSIPGGAAGGDLGGTYPNPTVEGIQGDDIPDAIASTVIRRKSDNTGWELTTTMPPPDTAVTPGAYGDAANVPAFTVDAQGRITSVSNVTITGVPPVAHALLSTYHSDVTAAAVQRGDLVVGIGATPTWQRYGLSVPAAGVLNYLGVNNGETEPTWKSASSNPGAAAAILASDASGYLQLVRLGIEVSPGFALQVGSGTVSSVSTLHQIIAANATDARIGAYVGNKGVSIRSEGTYGAIFAYDYAGTVALNLALNQFGGNVGIGTTAPDKKVEINSATGACLRLTYNDASGSAATFVDFDVTSVGTLNITPTNTASTPAVTVAYGLHVGATADPGDNNLMVDGVTGLGATPSSSFRLFVDSDGTIVPLLTRVLDATTTSVPILTDWRHRSSGTPANGFGAENRYILDANGGANNYASREIVSWVDAAVATRKARRTLSVYDTAEREAIRFEASGAAAMIGFLGANAVVRPAATVDLRTALINLGLYTTGGASPLDLNDGQLSAGRVHIGGTSDPGDNNLLADGTVTISNAAPSLILTDTTASAKSLTVVVDANYANFRESAGAASSLVVLDLANNRFGVGVTPAYPSHFKQTLNIASTDANYYAATFINKSITGSATLTNASFAPALHAQASVEAGYSSTISTLGGVIGDVTVQGGTVVSAIAHQGLVRATAGATITNGYVFYNTSYAAGGTVTNFYVVHDGNSAIGATLNYFLYGANANNKNYLAGISTFANTTDASALGTAGLIGLGGLSITKKAYIGSDVHLTTKILTYNNVATEGYGVPAIVDDVALTGQHADIASTNFTNGGTAGTYDVYIYLLTTVAEAGTGIVTLTISWNDGVAARGYGDSQIALTSTSVPYKHNFPVYLGSGSISYAVAIAGSYGTTARYALYMSLVRRS